MAVKAGAWKETIAL